MAAGLGLLRLEPRAFWAMTPKELEAALRGLLGPSRAEAPLGHGELASLMKRFPDQSTSLRSSGGRTDGRKDVS